MGCADFEFDGQLLAGTERLHIVHVVVEFHAWTARQLALGPGTASLTLAEIQVAVSGEVVLVARLLQLLDVAAVVGVLRVEHLLAAGRLVGVASGTRRGVLRGPSAHIRTASLHGTAHGEGAMGGSHGNQRQERRDDYLLRAGHVGHITSR